METRAIEPYPVVGIVLAGGQALRLGGLDKALQPLGSQPLIDHVMARIAPQVRTLAISANGDPQRFARYGLPVLADADDKAIEQFAGPLAGLLAGLRWAATLQPAPHRLLTVPTDTPFLPWSLVHDLSRAGPDVVLACAASGLQQACGLWPVSLAEPLAAFLRQGGRRIRDWCAWLEGHAGMTVTTADFGPILVGRRRVDPFFNINDATQLAVATDWITPRQAVLGIAGWKNAGKTTLTERLVAEFVRRGLTVSTVKHAHHSFDIDHTGTDSFRHRQAGAREVIIVSHHRVALMHELSGAAEPTFEAILAKLAPSDLVIVEGYKTLDIPKIEVRGADMPADKELATQDGHIIAIAAAGALAPTPIPVYDRDNVPGLADFISRRLQLST